MTEKERKVLRFLAEGEDYYDGFGLYSSFAAIMANTRLKRTEVRRACRSLARKGFTVFGKGLWSEDGKPAGSGYAITKEGARECSLSSGE